MNRINPITEDYKLLLVFKNIGLKLVQQVKVCMSSQPYNSFFKEVTMTEQHELRFSYFNHKFKTGIELFFNHSKMPKSAFLATYYLPAETEKSKEEIVSYAFDMEYNINDIYTFDDFADYYLIEFHQNLKKCFSDNHIPFTLKSNSK